MRGLGEGHKNKTKTYIYIPRGGPGICQIVLPIVLPIVSAHCICSVPNTIPNVIFLGQTHQMATGDRQQAIGNVHCIRQQAISSLCPHRSQIDSKWNRFGTHFLRPRLPHQPRWWGKHRGGHWGPKWTAKWTQFLRFFDERCRFEAQWAPCFDFFDGPALLQS